MKDNNNAIMDTVDFYGVHAIDTIRAARMVAPAQSKMLARKGDINDGAQVAASGITAIGKWLVAMEQTITADGGNRFLRFRDEIIAEEFGGAVTAAKIEEIPTFGARYDAYTADTATVYTLARSFVVKMGTKYAAEILARRGLIIPTICDYDTAEKVAKILNRIFVRKEKADEVFGKSANDVAQARIRTLEETQKRLLAEIATLKELKGGKVE